ncbi:hypothetical protein [Kitasatospora sp. NPDC051914]|uniref:hypothetical protein n=1 Tax=Kitasatospora sp. NPDC051914 TaxID=3154945 RepID=UPI00343BB89B
MDGDQPEGAAELEHDKFSTTVTFLCGQFVKKSEALYDLISAAVPAIEHLDSGARAMEVLDEKLKFVPPDTVLRFKKFYIEYADRFPDRKFSVKQLMEAVWEEFRSDPHGAHIFVALHEMFATPARKPILLELLVVSIVSAYEALLAELVEQFFKVSPEALEKVSRDREKEFSLRDLKSLGTIEDAVDLAISRRVEELMFGSFAEWRKFFIDRMNLSFEDYAVNWEALREVFQRRHILVHNGGEVSKRYLSNVDSSLTAGLTVGQRVSTDEDYVRAAIEQVATFGVLLANAVILKFRKGDADRVASFVAEFSYGNLQRGRNSAVVKCSSFIDGLPIAMGSKMIARVNSWIARSSMNDPRVNGEVAAWDVSALDPKFLLARHCLLGNIDESMTLVRSLHSQGALTVQNILEWPLLEPLRGSASYREFAQSLDLPSEWLEPENGLYLNPKTRVLHRQSCMRRSSSCVPFTETDDVRYSACQLCRPHRDRPQLAGTSTDNEP